MDRTKLLKFLKQYTVITIGCVIYSLGVALFLDANNIASGGLTGIAIIINYLVENALSAYPQIPAAVHSLLDTGTLIIILNIPLFILGAVYFGKKFFLSTVYATVFSSLLIDLFNFAVTGRVKLPEDLMLSGILGGALFGGGLGLIFRMGSTTGGTDIIVKILRKKFRYIRTGVISLSLDMVITVISIIVFKDFKLACYTVLSIVVMTVAFDWVLYGGNSAKLVYIITVEDKAAAISEKIIKELDISATFVDGEGAYSGSDKRIILCAIKNFLYPKLRDVVREIDPNAFTIVTSAKEIYGEGYKNPHDEDL